jgi:hypothetical protein
MLDQLLSWLQTAFETALVPFRAVMVMLGFAPSDMQVWTFMVGLFLLALVLPEAYSSYVLRRRRMRTTGTCGPHRYKRREPLQPHHPV